MVRRRGILGVSALVGAGVGIVLIASRSARRPPEFAGDPAGVIAKNANESPPARDVSRAAIEVGSMKGEPAWTLRGRLMRYSDPEALEPTQPAAGALLRLSLGDDAKEPHSDFAPREVRSGSDGRFEFTGVPGKAEYRLDVDAEGCALQAIGFELPEFDEPGSKQFPDIMLEEHERLVVVVKGPRGQPVESARVSARLVSARKSFRGGRLGIDREEIDAQLLPGGQYIFERLSRGVHEIVARSPGYAFRDEQVQIPRSHPIELHLKKGNKISGTVRSTAGEAIPGARVQAVFEGREAVTGEDGYFVLEDLNCFFSCQIEVSAQGFCDLMREVDTPRVDIVLPRETVFSGRVLSASTRLPLRNATVSANYTEMRTDVEGSFRLEKIPPGPHEIHVEHADHAPLETGTWHVAEGEQVNGIELELVSGLNVQGKVITASSAGLVSRATVTLNSERTIEVTCDAAGAFDLRGLSGGEYTVRVAAKGYSESVAIARVPPASSDEWTFTLEEEASLFGRVLGPDGKPITGAHVYIGYRGEQRPQVFLQSWDKDGWTDSRGAYGFSSIPAYSDYCLLARLHGKLGITFNEGISLAAGEKRTVDLRFGGGCIRGRVITQGGFPVRDASVMAHRDHEKRLLPMDLHFPELDGSVGYEWAEVNAAGEFELLQLPPCRYSISAISGEYSADSMEVELEEGTERSIEIIMEKRCTVSGQVVDERGKPVEGVTVDVSTPGQVSYRVTDEAGHFTAGGLEAGRGVIKASGFGLHAAPVACDSPSSGNVITVRPNAVLTGRVVAPGHQAPPTCSLNFFRMFGEERDEIFVGATDAASRFTAAVPPGKYFLEARTAGFACNRLEVELSPGAHKEVVIELVRSGSVQVHLDGKGLDASDFWLAYLESPASPPLDGIARVDNAEGIRFDDVPPGSAALVALTDRGLARRDGIVVTAGTTTEVLLPAPAVQGIFGTVTRRGEPLHGLMVEVRGPGGPHLSRTSSGWYQIEDLEPGAYEIHVEHSAGRIARVKRGEATRLDVELAATLVSGTVSVRGKPAANVSVEAYGLLGSYSESTVTDASGEWSLQLRAPEEYSIVAGSVTRDLVLAEGQSHARVVLEIEKLPRDHEDEEEPEDDD